MAPAEYCREIEAYLCRKNEGHLVRIVGPAFEQVCGWAEKGVPLKVVCRGIDVYCERHQPKGRRRRPVRIEFCEADILDLFDAWRRAVGVPASEAAGDQSGEATPRKAPLTAHIERVIARLATLRAKPHRPEALDHIIEDAIRELEGMHEAARQARGETRSRLVEQLAGIDRRVIDAVRGAVDAATASTIRQEADAELAPFGARLAPEARARASAAAFDRLVREAQGVPVIAYE